jgi:DnaJ-class molecular chaperone
MEDFYKILELSRDATKEQIKKAYHNLSRKYHPDYNQSQDAISKFRKIAEAYETLNDQNKKHLYDSKLPKPKPKLRPTKTADDFKKKDHYGYEISIDLSKDPNLGLKNIKDAPPPKYDIWGQPIKQEKQNYFRDSVTYSGARNEPEFDTELFWRIQEQKNKNRKI